MRVTLWAYDIETENWDQLVLARAVSETGEVVRMRTDRQCADWYESLPSTDVALSHNGGGYDFLHLIAVTPHLTWTGNLAGSAIVTCRAQGGALCVDTFRLFPMSLAAWTGEKSETGLTCARERHCVERDCGGYCQIRRSMSESAKKRLGDYCENDCRILLRAYQRDVTRLSEMGLSVITSRGNVRATIGGVAWHTAAEMASLDPNNKDRAVVDWDDYNAGRAASYGGRTEVFRTFYNDVGRGYDVNGMYPHALTCRVPVGNRTALVGAAARRAYERDELGMFHASVMVPRTDVPPLPSRYTGETKGRLTPGRMLWTTGWNEGTWVGLELRNAEARGAKILAIDSADVFSDSELLFNRYVRKVYRLRKDARATCPDGNPEKCRCDGCRMGSVLKFCANALTGKLGQRTEVCSLVVRTVEQGPPDSDDEGRVVWDQCGGPNSRVYSRTTNRLPSSGLTWAYAVLTARSRVILDERLARHSGNLLYCDTDSTKLCRVDSRDVHQSQLGKWKDEGEIYNWRALAPKAYRYKDGNGKETVRARGVPHATWKTIDALARGETIERVAGVERIRTSGGRFVARTVRRTHLDAHTNRCGTRFVERDGITRPLHRKDSGEYV